MKKYFTVLVLAAVTGITLIGCATFNRPGRVEAVVTGLQSWRYEESRDEMTGELISSWVAADSINEIYGWGGYRDHVQLQVHCEKDWIIFFGGKFRANSRFAVDPMFSSLPQPAADAGAWRYIIDSRGEEVSGRMSWYIYGDYISAYISYNPSSGAVSRDSLESGGRFAIEVIPWDMVAQRVDWNLDGFADAFLHCQVKE